MAFLCGNDAIIKADNSGSKVTVAQVLSWSFSDSLETRERKVAGNPNTQRSVLCASEDWSVTLEILYDPNGSDVALIRKGQQRDFFLYPEGDTTGDEQITLTSGIVTEFNIDAPSDDDVKASVTIVSSGTNPSFGTAA